MISITEKRVPIQLGGESHTLIFNANTMCAYEEATGKFFLDTVAALYDAMKPIWELAKDAPERDKKMSVLAMDVMRKVPMTQLRALIWAALHTYKDEEPVWPFTLHQIGRKIQPTEVPNLFTAFLKGQGANSPSESEMGESPAVASPASGESQQRSGAGDGGERSIELPEDAFASVSEK